MGDEAVKLHRYAVREILKIEEKKEETNLFLRKKGVLAILYTINSSFYFATSAYGLLENVDSLLYFLCGATGVLSGTVVMANILDIIKTKGEMFFKERLREYLEDLNYRVINEANNYILWEQIIRTGRQIAKQNNIIAEWKTTGFELLFASFLCAYLLKNGSFNPDEIEIFRFLGILSGVEGGISLNQLLSANIRKMELEQYMNFLTDSEVELELERKRQI